MAGGNYKVNDVGAAASGRSPNEYQHEKSGHYPAETSFRMLVEAIRDYAIFMLDPGGRVVTWNPGAARIKGYSADEILGQHFSCFYTQDAIDRHWPEYELERAATLGRFQDEGWRVRKDGSLFWANVTITAIYDEGNRLRGFAKVTRDMSEPKRLEALEESSQRMNEFLATLAHELRNPLAPLRNAIGILQMHQDLAPEWQRCSEMVDRQLSHLTRLVDDLLDVGRITSGKIELRKSPVLMDEIISRSIETVRPSIDTRRQRIERHLPAGLWVHGDATRLVQVFQNLLHNASKFSPECSHIALEGFVDGRSIVIRTVDKGCGIARDTLESIFQLFVQGDQQKHLSETGLGIGLTLCRSIVELHGGSIRAQSDGPGKGSVFTVRLPIASKARVDAVQPKGMTLDVSTCLRVLIVDDNHDSADSLAILIRMKEHDALAVYHGNQAMDAARRLRPHLVLMDLAMPDIDGFVLLQSLQRLPEARGAVYAAMTGFGLPGDRDRTRTAGFHEHLVKPVSMQALDQLLSRAEEARALRTRAEPDAQLQAGPPRPEGGGALE